MKRSYSKKACPWDNACIESFLDEYELGVKIDPVSFIKKTNADDIEFPDIEATTVQLF